MADRSGEAKMYKRILIATDGSALARRAEAQGFSLAKELHAEVIVVTVTELWSPLELAAKAQRGAQHPVEDYEKHVATHAQKILAAAKEVASQIGIACDTFHVSDKHPAEGIIETANARECDLIVMASHGRRGFQRVLLGSQAAKVLTYSLLPVLVCK
jgi:nucleotide-binding universal stress UspA family protein